MLIRKMTFVFHKSKHVETRETLKKLLKKINTYEGSLLFLTSDFCSLSTNEQSCMVNDNRHELVNLSVRIWWWRGYVSGWRKFATQPFLQHSAATQALKVRIPQRDTMPLFDPTLFPLKSTLFFACLLFCKTNSIFLTSAIQTLNHAKQNWI